MRRCVWIMLLGSSVALNAQPARSWDLVTYQAPGDFKVVEKADGAGRVELTKASNTSYCIVAIYTSTPASRDLEASFAAEWEAVALKTVQATGTPRPTLRNAGNARAAIATASATAGGQPVAVTLLVLDAGANVASILTLTPAKDAQGSCASDVERMLSTLVVKRVERLQAAPQTAAGKLVVPPAPATIRIADMAGEWGHNDGITTRYVDRTTGAPAGFDSLHFTSKWTITSAGQIALDFFGIRNGKKITEKSNGTVALTGGVLVIRMTNMQRYVLRGWLELPDMTIMKLNGPWYEAPIPANIFSNPAQGANLDQNWVRKK